jgi:hypothetical protein
LRILPPLHFRPWAPSPSVLLLLIFGFAGAPISAGPRASDESAAAPTDAPEGGKWPDETNTGVPAGTALQSSGNLVISVPGAVVTNLEITGAVEITAPNVKLMNARVRNAGFDVIRIKPGLSGVVIQDCEIDGVGAGNDGSNGIHGSGTFLRNNIKNVENGITLDGGATIKDNYIHDLRASGAPHYDGIQIDGGISDVTISHNTVINPHGQTSAIMIDNYFGPISNIRVENNRLVGGGYTVYSDGQFRDAPISGVAFINNRLVKGYWGYHSFVKNAPVWRGNVNDATGRPLGQN